LIEFIVFGKSNWLKHLINMTCHKISEGEPNTNWWKLMGHYSLIYIMRKKRCNLLRNV